MQLTLLWQVQCLASVSLFTPDHMGMQSKQNHEYHYKAAALVTRHMCALAAHAGQEVCGRSVTDHTKRVMHCLHACMQRGIVYLAGKGEPMRLAQRSGCF